MKLKPIESKITLELTLEEAIEYNDLVDRYWSLKKGTPTEDSNFNTCPRCGNKFEKGNHYCRMCGQWVSFVESDTVPL